MKRIILILSLLCSNAFAAITDGKFSINQIFDVQYYWNGNTLHASNFIAPYNKNFQTVTVTAGQYFQFFPSTTNPGTYGLKLMNSNGTQHSIVHDTGDITALGSGAIFYIGSGFFGNVITTSQGYSYGASASFTNMDTSVTSDDLNNYTYASSTPLASGQTAAPPPPAGPTIEGGTITQTNAPANQTITSGGSSSAGPTTAQTTRYNAWNNGSQATDNYLYIDQVGGNYNTVNITQSGTKNTMDLGINGSSNTVNATQTGQNYLNALVQGNTNAVTSLQTNTSGTNYQETKIMSGNSNTINVTQKDNGNNLMFNTVTGSNNSISAVQEGGGNHYLENKLTGNGNSVLANQLGSTGNKANIDLTNAGGVASVDLQQSGGKSFTIIQSCTNPAGCNTVIRQ